MAFSNSSLVSYVKISPNKTLNRNHTIDTISIHTMAGNCSVETCGAIFQNREASSNYGIGSDGRIAMYVEEKDRSWCSSNKANDMRAVTIEVASIESVNYKCSTAAWNSLVKLCADICKRNSIKELRWSTNKNDRINHVNGCNMTVHRDFKNKSCPGAYLYANMCKLASEVNLILNKETNVSTASGIVDSNEAVVPNIKYIVPDDKFWWDSLANGFNEFARAGIMGSIFAESGLRSNNLQNNFESKLKMTDEQYTEAVDKGTYKNFIKDGAGYGYCQWTFYTRKEKLLTYAKETKRSIGDRVMQFEFFVKELAGYPVLLNILANAKSVKEASDAFLTIFEKPADQSEAVKIRRASYGQSFYDKFAKGENGQSAKVPYLARVTAANLNIRKEPNSSSSKTGTIRNHGVYTIIEESLGSGADMWGKLKSGQGWIALSVKGRAYIEKV